MTPSIPRAEAVVGERHRRCHNHHRRHHFRSLTFDSSEDDSDCSDDDDDDDHYQPPRILPSSETHDRLTSDKVNNHSAVPHRSTDGIPNRRTSSSSNGSTTSQPTKMFSDYFIDNQRSIDRGQYHCCYILRSLDKNTQGDENHCCLTYIGSTKNPLKRWRQHNGFEPGGAEETKTHRPWEIVAIVDGFRDDETSKKFEKAWQTPNTSLRVRNAIGDYWAKDLVEKEVNSAAASANNTIFERRGFDGNLATLKCLLNECQEFRVLNLRVNFFHPSRIDAFLEATYQNHAQHRLPMFPINVITSQTYQKEFKRLKQQPFTNQGFRWELLDAISDTMKNQTDILPSHWLKLDSFCSAVRQSNAQQPFLDEFKNQMINEEDMDMFSEIALRGIFFNLKDAIRINPLHAETFIDRSQYMTGFRTFSDSHNDKSWSKTETIDHFLNAEEERLNHSARSRESDLWWSINIFIEKLQHARAVNEPNRQVAHQNANQESSRYTFTNVQESVFQRFCEDFNAIRDALDSSNLRLGLTDQQIKNKIKNDARNDAKRKRHSSANTQVGRVRSRKMRKVFTGDEDDAILNGISMYAKNDTIFWGKILKDKHLGPCLEGRTAEVIRKRYENVLKENPRGIRIIRHF